jgi:hypothetical protein
MKSTMTLILLFFVLNEAVPVKMRQDDDPSGTGQTSAAGIGEATAFNAGVAMGCFWGYRMSVNDSWNPTFANCEVTNKITFINGITVHISDSHNIINGTKLVAPRALRTGSTLLVNGTQLTVKQIKQEKGEVVNVWTNGVISVDGVVITTTRGLNSTYITEPAGDYIIANYADENQGKILSQSSKHPEIISPHKLDGSCFESKWSKTFSPLYRHNRKDL